MKIDIKSRFDAQVIFSHDSENNTVRLTVEAAVKAGANLEGAYLGGANLGGANLEGANLEGANSELIKLTGARPILQIGPIGSRAAYLIAYLTDHGVYLKAGCFFGTVVEFEARLAATHKGNQHETEYRAALQLIEIHRQLWGETKCS